MNTMSGQCQRYQEYDQSPTATMGRTARPRLTMDPSCDPAMRTSAVPATGSSAMYPGKGMTSVMAKAETRMSTPPARPAT